MARCLFSLAVLLGLSPMVMAQYGLIKIDLNQVDFADLANFHGGGTGGKPPPNPGPGPGGKFPDKIAPKDPLTKTEDGVWIFGFFELRSALEKKELLKFQPDAKNKGPSFVRIDHSRWGKDVYFYTPMLANVEQKYLDKKKLIDEFRTRNSTAKNVDEIIRLANWALTHGLYREFDNSMSSLKNSGAGRLAYERFVQLRAEFKKPPTAEMQFANLNQLNVNGYRTIDSPEGHYRVYYKPSPELTEASLKWRLARMEETFANFYYWFALQENVPLPARPATKLAVIIENSLDFPKQLKEWGVPPGGRDGFTFRPEALTVLTTKPQGDVYQYLDRNLTPVRLTMRLPVDDLLRGVSPTGVKIWEREDVQKNQLNVAMIQSLTVLQKVMEDEVLTAAINRECTRQLAAASGLLARNVAVPEWVQHGATSFFSLPPASLHPNFGLPRDEYLTTLKNLRGKMRPDKTAEKSAEILLNLVSDNYYQWAHNDLRILNQLEKKGLQAKERRELLTKARESHELAQAASWSLIYYLAVQRKMHYLSRYADQLNQLPRNAIILPNTLQNCFGKAFDLMDDKVPSRIDNAKLQRFAEDWFTYMTESVSPGCVELEAFINPPPPEKETK